MYGFTKEVRERNRLEVQTAGGITNLQESLKVPAAEKQSRGKGEDAALRLSIQIQNRSVSRVGVVVDADTNAQDRWESLRNAVRKLGYESVPERLDANGFVAPPHPDDKPAIGVWIMPNNVEAGMIETFARQLRSPADRLWARAERAVADIPNDERLFSAGHAIKATIHTWLAWQAEPGKPIGQAIKVRYLLHDAEPARQLMGWFQRLFALDVNA